MSIFFMVVSSTGCPVVGKAAIEDCKSDMCCIVDKELLTFVPVCCSLSILILALAGLDEIGVAGEESGGEGAV